MSNLGRPSKGKLLVNITMSVLPNLGWCHQCQRRWNEQRWLWYNRKLLRCVSAYRTVSSEAVCMLTTKIPPIELVMDECKRIYRAYSATHRISLGSGKVLWVRCDKKQITLQKWEEQLSGSSKGEWTHPLIHNLEAWLERGHRGAFDMYLYLIKLVESPKCANWDRRRWDDDTWQTHLSVWHFNRSGMTRWPPYKRWVRSVSHWTVWFQLC